MYTNVSTSLREFPRVRRAALAGEDVIIETREGNLILRAEASEKGPVLGSMANRIIETADDIDAPTLPETEWGPAL